MAGAAVSKPYYIELFQTRYPATRKESELAKSMVEFGLGVVNDIREIDRRVLESDHFTTFSITWTAYNPTDPDRPGTHVKEPILPCLAYILRDMLEWSFYPVPCARRPYQFLSGMPEMSESAERQQLLRVQREQAPSYSRPRRHFWGGGMGADTL